MRNRVVVSVLVVVVLVVAACRDTGNVKTNQNGSGGGGVIPMISIVVPDDVATITEAIRIAPTRSKQPGDVIVEVRPGTYNAASGEIFPITITKNLTVRALGDGVVLEYELPQPISAMMNQEDGTMVSGLTFKSSWVASSAGAAWGIQAFGVRNITVSNNIFFMRNGINCSGGGGFHIQNNVFVPPYRSAFGRGGGNTAIEVPASERLVIRNNTIVGMSWGVIVANSAHLELFENIIVDASAAAVSVDDATGMASSTDLYYRNDLWRNNSDYFNSTKSQAMAGPVSPYGADFSADPIFVDWENDFRIHTASRAAKVAIPQPKPVGVPDFVRIGAKPEVSYRTAMTLALDSNSPRGTATKSPNTEVLRFSVTAAPTADVELKQGHLIMFEMFTTDPNQPSRPMPQILIAETPLGAPLSYHQASFSTGNRLRLGVGVTQPATIDAGKTKTFSIYVDTTGFQIGDTIQFVLKRLDWSDGVLPRINDGRTQRIDGYTLSF